MRDEPCVRIPISELKWMIDVAGAIYVNLVDRTQAIEVGLEELADRDDCLQDEVEMAYLNELLEARLREALTGKNTAPALSINGGTNLYLQTMIARRNDFRPGDAGDVLAGGR